MPRYEWVGPLLVAIASAFFTISIVNDSSLWIDEVFSFNGLSMNPLDVLGWLPQDRNPPLYYWLGWLWAKIFGLNELSMRSFGIILTSISAAIVFISTRKISGELAAWISAFSFAICANTLIDGVAIRTYPLYTLLSSLVWYSFISLAINPEKRSNSQWITFGVFVSLVVCTHPFGLLFAFVVLFVLGVYDKINHISLKPYFVIILVVSIISAIMLPIYQSSGVSVTSNSPSLYDVLKYLYRFLANGVSFANIIHVYLIFSGAIILGFGIFFNHFNQTIRIILFASILLGLAITISAYLLIDGFNVIEPKYSIWARPAIFILLGSSVSISKCKYRKIFCVAAILFILGQLGGTVDYINHADIFSNGPHSRLSKIINDNESSTAVLILKPEKKERSSVVFWLYLPLAYQYKGNVSLFIEDTKNDTMPLAKTIMYKVGETDLNYLNKYKRLLILENAKFNNTEGIIEEMKFRSNDHDNSTITQQLINSSLWELKHNYHMIGILTVDVVELIRRDS